MEIYFLLLILLILKKKKIAIFNVYTATHIRDTLMGFDENVDQMTKEVTS